MNAGRGVVGPLGGLIAAAQLLLEGIEIDPQPVEQGAPLAAFALGLDIMLRGVVERAPRRKGRRVGSG